jgi:hypothetical protein
MHSFLFSAISLIRFPSRLRAVVQSRQEQGGTKCRFCGAVLQSDAPPNLGTVGPVCTAQTCIARAQQACPKVHMCGRIFVIFLYFKTPIHFSLQMEFEN